ncbi:MAG TPA: PAS domain-containing protein, partial [Prolixibacteraceae bacterium]|nr:PAS domain-containing protein [Prolixibacteraceae bacterium]
MIYEQNAFLSGFIKDPELSYKIIDSLPFPINYRDSEGFYITCNKAFERLLGRSREELIGKSYLESQPAEVDEMIEMRDKELFESQTDIVYEHQY